MTRDEGPACMVPSQVAEYTSTMNPHFRRQTVKTEGVSYSASCHKFTLHAANPTGLCSIRSARLSLRTLSDSEPQASKSVHISPPPFSVYFLEHVSKLLEGHSEPESATISPSPFPKCWTPETGASAYIHELACE
jgi:hypothetical protein